MQHILFHDSSLDKNIICTQIKEVIFIKIVL